MPDLPPEYDHPISNGLTYPMVKLDPGIFIMGNEKGYGHEKPEHLVNITYSFYIGKYPVTQKIWKVLMHGENPAVFAGDQRPVARVSWLDIVQGGQDDKVSVSFLDRLKEMASSQIKGYKFRLPTEAEWEYAAKGGHKKVLDKNQVHSFMKKDKPSSSEIFTMYTGSDQLKEVGWYDSNSHKETKCIMKKKPNELGLYDMSGNVFEWCQDFHSNEFYFECKEKGIVKNPINKYESRFRIARGGSWFHIEEFCRISSRNYGIPTDRRSVTGFRLVLVPD